MDNASGFAFIAGFFLLLLTIFGVQIQWRRLKYKRIANALGAEYQSQGLFKSGKIAGSIENKRYGIENVEGFHGSTWTLIGMECTNRGIPLQIHGHFFKPFPNWKYAFSMGNRTERVFVTKVTLVNVGILLEEGYRAEVQRLFQEFAFLNYPFLKKGTIRIEQDKLSYTAHGILNNLEMIRQILSVLAGIAGRIESEPIKNLAGDKQQDQPLTPISVTLS